jgi:hypothetical protein
MISIQIQSYFLSIFQETLKINWTRSAVKKLVMMTFSSQKLMPNGGRIRLLVMVLRRAMNIIIILVQMLKVIMPFLLALKQLIFGVCNSAFNKPVEQTA